MKSFVRRSGGKRITRCRTALLHRHAPASAVVCVVYLVEVAAAPSVLAALWECRAPKVQLHPTANGSAQCRARTTIAIGHARCARTRRGEEATRTRGMFIRLKNYDCKYNTVKQIQKSGNTNTCKLGSTTGARRGLERLSLSRPSPSPYDVVEIVVDIGTGENATSHMSSTV